MTDIRDKSSNFLSESISSATGGQDASSAAAQLEQALFAKHGESTSNDYRGEVRNLGLTLKKDNPQLANDVLAGNVAPDQLVNMSIEDMKTDAQAASDNQLRQQNLNASIGIDELDPDNGAAISQQQERDMETYGEVGEESLGEEGEFKARAQPKVGEAMRGVEFETGI